MAINRIGIENFTVFDKFEMDFCNGINVFIGENGTGKTHLLKLLYALCEWKAGVSTEEADPTIAQKIQRCFQYVPFKDLASRNQISEQNKDTIKLFSSVNNREKSYQIWDFSKNGQYECQSSGEQDYLPSLFIPAKDMLTHGGLEKDYIDRHLPLDITLIDILNKAGVSALKNLPDDKLSILTRISDIIGGKIIYKNDRYYTERPDGTIIDFAAEAEGYKKLGLIYRLIETGRLEKGSVLIWDEPESNLNPNLVPLLVDILLAFEKVGIQMFFATHDYFFSKFLEVRKQANTQIMYHALYKRNHQVLKESQRDFELLENNSIITQSISLFKEEIKKVME